MIREAISQLRRSLGYRTLVPIASGCLLLATVGWAGTSWFAGTKVREHITRRAEVIARMVGYATEAVHDDTDVQRIVEALGAEPMVKEIVVASGEPPRVIASTRNAIVGRAISQMFDIESSANLEKSLRSRRELVDYHREDRLLGFSMPLMIARDHVHAEPGAVVVHIDTSPIEDEERAWAALAAMSFLVAAALVLVGGMFILHRLVLRPVIAIARAVHAESGEVPVLSDDEIGELAKALNVRRRESDEARSKLEAVVHDLLAAREQAESANRAKSDFLANMSHEIRTPMSAILGYSQLMAEGGEDRERLKECVQRIRRNGEHLLSIIDGILDLSKIEAGKLAVDLQPTNPIQVLLDVESMISSRCTEKGLRFDLGLDTAIPEAIQTDPVRLRQILANLVSNAAKFTESGGVTVRASFVKGPAHRGTLVVRVRDTGIGIAPEALSRLFKPFGQLDTSASRKFGGIGLGLSISRSFAKLLGGDIAVTSEPGRGSEFTVTIVAAVEPGVRMLGADCLRPQSRSEAADVVGVIGGVGVAGGARAEGSGALSGVRIFFVEDGPDKRRLIEHHLRKAGAEVRTFTNGLEALCAMTNDQTPDGPLAGHDICDLVLTDMQMPVMDGYTLASKLRAKGWTQPIVALTAHAMVGDDVRCREAGCDRYATKPVSKDTLIRVCQPQRAARHTA